MFAGDKKYLMKGKLYLVGHVSRSGRTYYARLIGVDRAVSACRFKKIT